MTVFKSTDGLVVGQPISPFFGAQNGIQGPGAPIIPSPNASSNSGPQSVIHALASTGSVPMNANVTSVAGVATGLAAGIGGDNASVAEMMSSGNGSPSLLGVGVAGSSGNPTSITTAGINNQIFVGGISSQGSALSTGPAPTDTANITAIPMSGATIASNIVTSGFQG